MYLAFRVSAVEVYGFTASFFLPNSNFKQGVEVQQFQDSAHNLIGGTHARLFIDYCRIFCKDPVSVVYQYI